MELLLLVALWLACGFMSFAIVLGDLQRKEWVYMASNSDVILAAIYFPMGSFGLLIAFIVWMVNPDRQPPRFWPANWSR